ncbi:hypothetical protein FGSG_10711 [Fusarium graminearum PH-1]|uniref:Chromosome 1, complete genome n=1 Tax=Gibberella zeae (strain ATCC MYA-4620 / CBS 123657 / FGSC 9075 / NRRL 31084 / PH-1) TaxID=229533 RepID=I1S1U1_GIBZE|nr:hypothetical protein FGSG_10711 [Fusarium graminearum PH-1]ESU17462.1 hypothetical protein FGSG_10711 [Fusarium graminearum PH-1]KAI6763163.1 hypothetical protein HG531_013060 [Fusarium graminearum]CAF3434936.1 unnamed protein product [Fusarium graminearum]CEF76181.1 unnamed protein product [Fusarium graminearum]|eukprot:XP_011319724.1 hypothetical protein FGSG_10711 [Fusarium graminearum PH-1]
MKFLSQMSPDNETNHEISISHTWRRNLAIRIEAGEGELQCSVTTQGAHFVSPPPTPAFHYDIPIEPFAKDLIHRLKILRMLQNLRISLYGQDFADDWPVSRTPSDLVKEARAKVEKERDDYLASLDETINTDEEEEEWAKERVRKGREIRLAKW